MLGDALRSGGPQVSGWHEITPARVRAFADATADWQGIHLDEDAARAAGFDGPVAHGYLVLGLLSAMVYEILPPMPEGGFSVNYGFDRVRFVAPVPVGTRVRGVFQIAEIEEREDGGVRLRFDVTVEREGQTKPALVADWLTLFSISKDDI